MEIDQASDYIFNRSRFEGNQNSMDYSVLKRYYSTKSFVNFSVKYVVEGTEFYKVNGRDFKVESGQYLLAGLNSEGVAEIDSKENVKGICIDLRPELISEVTSNYLEPGAAIPDLNLNTFLTSSDFSENKYNSRRTKLGSFLHALQFQIKKNNSCVLDMNKEFYYAVAECLVADNAELYKPFQRLKVMKSGTKKDLFRKLLLAKESIDSNFMQCLDIADIARFGGLSEYHFFRLFKTSFGITPYQYILDKRLLYAHQILRTKHFSVSDAATSAGFNDIYNFSRAFKRKFGYPPSRVI